MSERKNKNMATVSDAFMEKLESMQLLLGTSSAVETANFLASVGATVIEETLKSEGVLAVLDTETSTFVRLSHPVLDNLYELKQS